MKLEEEIKQYKFKNEKAKALLNINYTNGFLISKVESTLKEFKLTLQQYNILRIIRGQNGKAISVGEIKTRMLDKNSDVSRLIERMRIKKIIERKISSNDRRQMDVSITKKGLELLSLIDPKEKQFDKMLSKLSEAEATQLNELLDKIRS